MQKQDDKEQMTTCGGGGSRIIDFQVDDACIPNLVHIQTMYIIHTGSTGNIPEFQNSVKFSVKRGGIQILLRYSQENVSRYRYF